MQTFWNQILDWATDTLIPWTKEYLPGLEHYVRDAFVALDEVVTPTYKNIKTLEKLTKIKESWKILREYLLKVLVQFDLNTQKEWVKRITYWVIRNLNSKPVVVRVVTEELVDVDSLPDDVWKEWLKRGKTTQDIDVTQLRDRELELTLGEFEEQHTQDRQEQEVVRQKSHVKGLATKLLPEDRRGELEELRREWLEKGQPKVWIELKTFVLILDTLRGEIQIKIENAILFKNRPSSKKG